MIAEFEADLTRLRTREGAKIAKAKGLVGLQRPVVVAGSALAAAYILVDVPRGGEVGKALAPCSLGMSVVAALLACGAAVRCRPAVLVRR